MSESPLFGDAEPEQIARTLRDDWRRFSAVAFVVLGLPEKWDAAVDEIARIRHAFARNDIDLDLTDELFMMVYDRLRVLPDMADRFERMMAVLALPSPHIAQRLREELAITPVQKQARSNKEWLAAYYASRRS